MQGASLEARSSQLSRDGPLRASAPERKLSVARMALKEGRRWTGVGEGHYGAFQPFLPHISKQLLLKCCNFLGYIQMQEKGAF